MPEPEAHDLLFVPCSVVPLLVLHRGGKLADETCAQLTRFLDEPWKLATRIGEVENVQKFFEDTRELPTFKLKRILTLPTWCVWLLELDGKSITDITSKISEITISAPNDTLAHIFVFHTTTKLTAEQITGLQNEMNGQAGPARGFVLMTKEDSLSGNTSSVARGLAAYLYAAWRRFCEPRGHETPSLDYALLLDAPGENPAPLHTLGMGVMGLDEAYHSDRIAKALHKNLVGLWLDPNSGVVPPFDSPPNDQFLAGLLPQPEFSVQKGEEATQGNEIIMGSEIYTLHCNISLPPEPLRESFTSRQHLMSELQKLCSHHFISQANHLPQAERVVLLRSQNLPLRLREPVAEHLNNFALRPLGFLQGLKDKLDQCAKYASDYLNSRTTAPEHHQPFANIQNLRVEIAQLPNLFGGIARYAVLLAMLSALILHSQLPGILMALWDEATARYYTVAFIILTALLGAGIVWFFVDRVHRIFSGLDHLRRAIHANVLLRLSNLLCTRLKESAAPLYQEITKQWAVVLENVRFELRKLQVNTATTVNTQDAFPDDVSDHLLSVHQSELVQQIHDAWIQKHHDFSALMKITPAAWSIELLALAKEVSMGMLRTLSFNDLVKHTGWSYAQKQLCLQNAIDSSRRPILPVSTLMPRCLCIVNPEWGLLGTQHRQVEFFDLSAPVLMAISPIPVPSV